MGLELLENFLKTKRRIIIDQAFFQIYYHSKKGGSVSSTLTSIWYLQIGRILTF